DERLPIAPRSKRHVLRHQLADLEASLPPDDGHLLELLSVITALENLPPMGVTTPAKVTERHREKEVVKRRLAALVEQSDAIRAHIDRAVATLNGTKEDPASFDLLDALLDEQAYRLAYWRVAGEEINYRRFFDINGLAAIRQEDPVVFEETHRILLRLLREGKIHGMRIDHPDGLYDPSEYLRTLQEEVVVCAARDALCERAGSKELADERFKQLEAPLRRAYADAFRKDPRDPKYRPLYVIVEKILSRKERIPEDWAIDGTTGYEFLNLLNGIFVARENEPRLDATYGSVVGRVELPELVRRNKKMIMKTSMVSEVNVLAHRLSSLSERSRHTRDFTLNSLRHALIEMVACFPIYRTYIHDWSVDDRDRAFIEQAYTEARKRTDEIDVATLDFLRDILLMKPILGPGDVAKQAHLAFVMKLQQVTGPVMAKGLEDTTFYVYNRLVSLNEVGGEPERFGTSVETFHRANDARRKRWPASLLASSTHDTKRSEDVRARIDVLSELPDAWERFVGIARDANEKRKVRVGDRLAPDAAEELLFYQTVLGAAPTWPLVGPEKDGVRLRIEEYMLKAVKEAKVNNSWTNHDPAYDEGIRGFIRNVFEAEVDDPFSEAMRALHKRCTRAGRFNSIAAQLLKICAPGVPDVYQGTELFDLSMVDPDNRRPVDYAQRRRLLEEDDARTDRLAFARELMQRPDDRLKLFVTATALRARRAQASLFLEGAYVPLETTGPRGTHLCAFARVHQGSIAIVIVPRLVASLVGDRNAWSDTFLVVPDEIAEQ
ncbi:MAG: malto-oligosyltrehalose synthase, partial [Polyangiales bacterium]